MCEPCSEAGWHRSRTFRRNFRATSKNSMSALQHAPPATRPLDLSAWRGLPRLLIIIGGVLALIGAIWKPAQFGYSWLLAFMFILSLSMGALFLVLMHHLFDASWSVPIRRICEHLACISFPTLLLLFIPIAILAPGIGGVPPIYEWMGSDPARDHAL